MKRNIVLILIACFFYMASPMMITPLIAGFTGSFGASGTIMGVAGGLTNLCSLACRPFAGNLADKISKYHLSMIGSVGIAVGCVLYVFSSSVGMVMCARIVQGVGYALCSVCMSTWMADMLPKEKIGSGMGLYGTVNALSMAVMPSVGINLTELLGYRYSFAFAGLFAVVVFLIVQFITFKDEPVPVENTGKGYRMQLISVPVIPIAIIIMLFSMPYCITQSFLVSYLAARGSGASASLFFLTYAVVLLVLRLSLRGFFDRWPFVVFALVSSCCACGAMLFLANAETNFQLLAAAALMAGGYGIMFSVCQSSAIRLAGEGHRGLANSTYYIGLDIGMSAGPVFGGVLFEHFAPGVMYYVLLLTLPPIFLVLLFLRRKKPLTV